MDQKGAQKGAKERMVIYKARRKMIWERLRRPKIFSASLIGTAMGAGLFPFAPGTAGTVAAIPVVFFTLGWSWPVRLLFWIFLIVLGTWSAKVLDEAMETQDNQNIVIDEVAGFGIAAWTVGESLSAWITAFVLFRILDALKPPPIRQIDRWSKNRTSAWWGGFGVIADDLVAGFQVLVIVVFLQWLRVLGEL